MLALVLRIARSPQVLDQHGALRLLQGEKLRNIAPLDVSARTSVTQPGYGRKDSRDHLDTDGLKFRKVAVNYDAVIPSARTAGPHFMTTAPTAVYLNPQNLVCLLNYCTEVRRPLLRTRPARSAVYRGQIGHWYWLDDWPLKPGLHGPDGKM
jgi:hypothetical protein